VAVILSCAMMLRYSLNMPSEALAIEKAVRTVLNDGFGTGDIGGTSSTSELGDKIVEALTTLLSK